MNLFSPLLLIVLIHFSLVKSETRRPGVPSMVDATADSSSITVHWKPPKDAGKILVRGYNIGWGENSADEQVMYLADTLTSYTIEHLASGVKYKISLSANNEMGDGPAIIKEVKTLGDEDLYKSVDYAPGDVPTLYIDGQALSSTSIKIAWRTDPVNVESTDFTAGQYTVEYGIKGKSDPRYLETRDGSIVIEDLKPNTEYEFRVKLISDDGVTSDFTKLDYVSTSPDAPSSAPHSFKSITTSNTDVFVSWKPPIEANGPITGYELYYTSGEPDADLESWNKEDIKGNITQFVIKDLPEGDLYLQMRAWNEYGKGPLSPYIKHTVEQLFDESIITPYPTTSGELDSNVVPETSLWISPKDNPIERRVGQFLSISCAPAAGRKLSDLKWNFPNNSAVPIMLNGKQRVYSQWSNFPRHLQLIFSELQYSDSSVYTCTATVDDRFAKQSVSLRVLPSSDLPTNTGEAFDCNFELVGACGWSSDPTGSLVWQMVEAGRMVDGFTMLLPRDHSTWVKPIKDSGGHYMYLQGLKPAEGSGRLISPVIQSGFSFHSCFTFWYFVGSGNKGKLTVYIVPADKIYERSSPSLAVNLLSGDNKWHQSKLQLKPVKNDFRIVIEVTKARDDQLTLAVDDVQVIPSGCADAGDQGEPEIKDDEVEVDLLRAVKTPFQDPSLYHSKGLDNLPSFGFRKGATVMVPYRYYLPKKFFKDFSILATVKPTEDDGGYLFALDNPFDTLVELGILLEPHGSSQTNITVLYSDHKKDAGSKSLASFLVNRFTGKWTQFALKIVGNEVSLYMNCQLREKQSVQRKPKQLQFDDASKLYIAWAGPILLHHFVGELQELKIFADPAAAETQCDADASDNTSGDDDDNGVIPDQDQNESNDLITIPPPLITPPPPEFPGDMISDIATQALYDAAQGDNIIVAWGDPVPHRPRNDFQSASTNRYRQSGGLRGEKGDRGDRGERGPQGPKGEPGLGLPGPPGESIRGDRGDRGEFGLPGPTGPPGPPGECGCVNQAGGGSVVAGPQGLPGQPGMQGPQGDVGPVGPKGERGDPGPASSRGHSARGERGEKGERGEPGPPGKSVADGGASNYLQGPKGDPGPPGPPGPPGNAGRQGDFGLPGVPGRPGPRGQPGVGQKGEKGDSSGANNVYQPLDRTNQLTGPQGPRGPAGPQGPQGQTGLPGFPGRPGPPGPPGPAGQASISNVVPGAERFSGQKGEKGDPGSGGPGSVQVVPGAVVYQTNLEMFYGSHKVPVGTIAFSLGSQSLFVRVNEGWREIKLEGFYRALDEPGVQSIDYSQTTPLPIYQPPQPFWLSDQMAGKVTRTKPAAFESVVVTTQQQPELTTISPQRPLPSKVQKDDSLHLIALNTPYNGNMNGVRGADFACYHQARNAGFTTTFRAFISSQVQDLDKIVHYGNKQSPVVNMRGDVLFDSWENMFRDGGAHFPTNVPIYSFNRRDILTDPTWPQKYVWHGSDTKGIRNQGKFCGAWRSDSSKETGMASPLNKHQLLAQQDFACNNVFAVLCVENMSKSNMVKRANEKRQARENRRLKDQGLHNPSIENDDEDELADSLKSLAIQDDS